MGYLLKKLRKDWSKFLALLINPASIMLCLYVILSIIMNFYLKKPYINIYNLFITPAVVLILGLFISRYWEEYNQRTIYKNQGELAIKSLDSLKVKITDRISGETRLNKEIKQFLKDVLSDLDLAKEAWENVNPIKDDLDDQIKKKDEVNAEIKKSEEKIDQ